MSSSPSSPNGQGYGGIISAVAPYIVPPVAASLSIIPAFRGFIAKSAKQLSQPVPRMSVAEGFLQGVKAAPTIGSIVGLQLVIQDIVEKNLFKSRQADKKKELSFKQKLLSSTIVGALSAPALAVFNGQTMGKPVIESLRSLTGRQIAAITTREGSFLLSFGISGPITQIIKLLIGERPGLEYASAFISGAVGSAVGHPADTALTLWQRGQRIVSVSQLMRGGWTKSYTIGGFLVAYKATTKVFNSVFGIEQ